MVTHGSGAAGAQLTPLHGPGLEGGYSQERVTLHRQLYYVTCKNGSSMFY